MIRAFQWDLARQVERLDWLLSQLPRYADWGYNELHVHLEDAVEYPRLPGIARPDAYTYREFSQLVEAATRVGIAVVPIVNLLGHTLYLIKHPDLRDLNELRAPDGTALERGQICPLHPRTLEIAEKLLRDMTPFCTGGKVHVGLDESFHLGKHPLSQREVEEVGLSSHFARYVEKLHALTSLLGLKMAMWGDMFYFLPEAISQIPTSITIYEWYYHAFARLPRVELFNFAEMDIATPLRQRGNPLFGCPMNGAFRYEPLPQFHDRLGNILSWWKHCHRIGAKGFLVSSWEPYRLAIELTTAVDAAAASLWLEPNISDPAEMLARGFQRAFGKQGRAAAKLALAADRYPFSGYPRWEINARWDTISRRDSVGPYAREERTLAKLVQRAKKQQTPPALRSSLIYRRYLAQRDVLVRRLVGKGEVAKEAVLLAKAQRAARAAARLMWSRSRNTSALSPNEEIVLSDQHQLRLFQKTPALLRHSVQLCYSVWNAFPAAQKVGVECQTASGGDWEILQACHTIEFLTEAARPNYDRIREHAAPLPPALLSSKNPRVRFFCEGIGQVKLGRVELRLGRQIFPLKKLRTWCTLGAVAPKRGWPDLTRRYTLEIPLPQRTLSDLTKKKAARNRAA
jgi:hypothetical protein